MAKIKVKQIEDLLIDNNNVLTVGAGKVAFSAAPENGGYVSGFGTDTDGIIKPIFAALPDADTFGTGLKFTPASATAGRIITLDDAYVRTTVIGLADAPTTGGASSTFVTGITYNQSTGKFAYTTGTTVSANDGKLFVNFVGETASTAPLFTANQGGESTLTLAKVANTGVATDVTTTAITLNNETVVAAGNVQSALETLAGKINAIDPIVTTVAAGTGIKVTNAPTTEGNNDITYTVTANFTVDTHKYTEGDKAGKTYIRIMDGTTVISETEADAFIKDGMLNSVELVTDPEGQTGKYIKLVWNTDAGKDEMLVPVNELVDVYKGDETYIKVTPGTDGHVISHIENGAEGSYGATNDASAEAAGTSIEFKVPSITVDAAGHVTEAANKTIKVALPAAQATETKEIYTPVEQKKTGENNGIFTVTEGACHFRMYMNGQLLDSSDYTFDGNTTVTYNGSVALENSDRMDLVYFVKETVTVIVTPTPQA